MRILAERTELEMFLRQSIEDVREEMGGRMKSGIGEMGVGERQRVLQLLLSKENVLALLYKKTFPQKGHLLPHDTLIRSRRGKEEESEIEEVEERL